MERFVLNDLIEWKKSIYRKPLLLRGARQVGKSWIVEHFGRTHYPGKIHIVNFEKRPDWHGIFEPNFDISRIIRELEVVLNSKIDIFSDLLFLDEIQACPKAILALRYFYESTPDLQVIAAGSLLEFALGAITFPVGRVQLLNMFPMSFAEYLLATGKSQLCEIVIGLPEKQPETIHQTLLNELRNYFTIGGLPECVGRFQSSGSFIDVAKLQDDLLATYRQDFSKYTPAIDSRCLNEVLSTAFRNVGQQIKYTELTRNFTGPTNKKAFDLLCIARLLHKIKVTSPTGLPLSLNASDRKFKALAMDIGLMSRMSGLNPASSQIADNTLGIFRGQLAEQFIGQEFLVAGQPELFYWAREAKSSQAEIDYLLVKDGTILPVEVKAGSSGRLRSLHMAMQLYPQLPEGYVFSDLPYAFVAEQRLRFLPLYYAFTCAQISRSKIPL